MPAMRFASVILSVILSGCLMMAAATASAQDHPKVSLKTTMGEIVIELYPEAAPKTVENFIKYVKNGHYKGTIFHRVINNFMIQAGGYDKDLKEKPTSKTVPNEARQALDHGLKNDLGTIAMARTDDPNSATSQFFINTRVNDSLDHQILPEGNPVEFQLRGQNMKESRANALKMTAGYTPFGKVIQGMDVVEKIQAVETGEAKMMQDVPNKPVIIQAATLLK
ncbi:peptidylprolyl isomerase [Undibacterium sp. Di26W]|uniref:peptidylprolyl isomerase n=1 Tax=Undibacterium sp. Di26W TaxID=3413035 RepID=UPI003BF2D253